MADDVQSVLADDNFKSLAIGEKDKVLAQVDPNYAGLPPRERAHALGVIHYGKDAVEQPQGSTLMRSLYGVGRGMNDVVEGIYQTFIHPINTVNAMASQTEEHLKKAKGETSTVGKLAEYGAAVPALGPFGQQLGERAGKGDVAGAVSEGLTASLAPSLAKELAPSPETVGRTLREPGKVEVQPTGETRVISKGRLKPIPKAIASAGKLVGGPQIADAIIPAHPEPTGSFSRLGNVKPPLPPPPDPEYVKQKTITEAQEAAQSENVKRTTVASKAKEAAFNKEGDEQMAIQRRYDEAQTARMDAEKVAKNAQFKADQDHAKELAGIEKSRQAELTAQAKVKQVQDAMDVAEQAKDAEAVASLKAQQQQAVKEANDAAAQKDRLYTQHGDALQRRGREQAALDKAAADASKEEEAAKAEATKKAAGKVIRPGSSGMRPTETEMRLTRLAKRRIWTPEDFRDAVREIGSSALRKPGEGIAEHQARVMGLIRSQRAAIGMEDIESGPSRGSQLPPPPTPKPLGP